MKKYLLDTSFLCALFNMDDVNHFQAEKISKNIINSLIEIPFIVFTELLSFSKNKVIRDINVKRSLEMANEIPFLTKNNIHDYMKFAENLRYSFTAIDSIILFLAKENDSELITLDKKLLKQYKNL